MFSFEFCEVFKNTLITDHLRTIAPDYYKQNQIPTN